MNRTGINSSFLTLSSQINKLFESVTDSSRDSFLLGKKKGYQDVSEWISKNANQEMKNISSVKLSKMLSEELERIKKKSGKKDLSERKNNKSRFRMEGTDYAGSLMKKRK